MRYKVKKIPEEVALKAAKEFVTTSISVKELQLKYNFTGVGTLYHWIRKFGLSQPNSTELKADKIMKSEKSKTGKEQELEKRIKDLEKQLEYQKLKTQAYEKMVEIAEREFSISIRKKYGSKQ
jgi:transposase-like protein